MEHENEPSVDQRRKYEPPYVIIFSDEDLANAEREAFLTSCPGVVFCPPIGAPSPFDDEIFS